MTEHDQVLRLLREISLDKLASLPPPPNPGLPAAGQGPVVAGLAQGASQAGANATAAAQMTADRAKTLRGTGRGPTGAGQSVRTATAQIVKPRAVSVAPLRMPGQRTMGMGKVAQFAGVEHVPRPSPMFIRPQLQRASGAATSVGAGPGAMVGKAMESTVGAVNTATGGGLGRAAASAGSAVQSAATRVNQATGGKAGQAVKAVGQGVQNALGTTGTKIVGELGTTLADATALAGAPKALSAISGSARQAIQQAGHIGRTAAGTMRTEITNAANAVNAGRMQPATAGARAIPRPPAPPAAAPPALQMRAVPGGSLNKTPGANYPTPSGGGPTPVPAPKQGLMARLFMPKPQWSPGSAARPTELPKDLEMARRAAIRYDPTGRGMGGAPIQEINQRLQQVQQQNPLQRGASRVASKFTEKFNRVPAPAASGYSASSSAPAISQGLIRHTLENGGNVSKRKTLTWGAIGAGLANSYGGSAVDAARSTAGIVKNPETIMNPNAVINRENSAVRLQRNRAILDARKQGR